MTLSRRQWLEATGLAAFGATLAPNQQAAAAEAAPPAIAALKPMTDGVQPISLEERRARVARAQELLAREGLDALLLAAGSSLIYFTGARWGNSERLFACVLTRTGEPAWVTPAFEKQRALEQIRLGTDVRAWEEHESPYALVASILKDRGVATGRLGIEETMPFVFSDGVGAALPAARLLSGTPVSAGCRVIKDAHELAIMQRACEITVAAHRAVFASLAEGMTQGEVSRLSAEAHRRLGMSGGSLVLFGKDAAFPHGTTEPQPLKAGDVVLMDGGGRLLDYASDITRSMVFGAKPTERQRRVWELVREAQKAALAAARPGAACESVDAAARKVIVDGGFGPDYKYLTHRLGHGIGMDGHEWTYLVRGNQTPLRPGMCFSNEPGIYVYGELGVRHEDIMTITADGARGLTKWSGTPEEPAVV